MNIMHIALQGCLKANDVRYGLTPDTGGHIKYLLELAAAAERQDPALRQQLVVRRFNDPHLGAIYAAPFERVSDRTEIIRIAGASEKYIAKEDMRFELPVLADALEAHIRAMPQMPDLLHGHYADGGMLAVEMKRRFGIPVIFTGHSLGRVKARTLTPPARGKVANIQIDGSLRDRVNTEETVIANADRIVASSIDEAELQYGMYREDRPERVRVNPPGCDLEVFRKDAGNSAAGQDTLGRFLTDPEKPTILAIARPVRKKNLTGLVRAFGEDPTLREHANLVIYAGTRDRIRDEDAEAREVLTEILTLIDDYDLWGHVALPKSHEGADISGIYHDAVERRGVFVNIALNEPFGLTLLEAAASGLPVVATHSGGPNDILHHCQNGTLVDPSDTRAVANAIREIISDPDLWQRYSEAGRAGSTFYSWDRHAREYLTDARYLSRHHADVVEAPRGACSMLVCDIDNTLTGDRSALDALKGWLDVHPETAFGIATGRSLHSALEVISEWDIPAPQFLVTSVGSEIYWVADPDLRRLQRDASWPDLRDAVWEPEKIARALQNFPGLQPQAEREQRRFKLSYFLDEQRRCAALRKHLTAKGLAFELIYSHGRYLDLLPKGASKGHAVQHVAQRLGVANGDIWAAGDSGNDFSMLRMVGKPIIVGNHSDELAPLRAFGHSYFARSHYAAGVLEGLEHSWTTKAAS